MRVFISCATPTPPPPNDNLLVLGGSTTHKAALLNAFDSYKICRQRQTEILSPGRRRALGKWRRWDCWVS